MMMKVKALPSAEGVLKCFRCTVTPPSAFSNEPERLCSKFDYSDRYIVECPYSTLCMKKHFTVNLTVPINGTVRDCAKQRYDYQDFVNGKWQLEVAIEEPYEEGCTKADDKGYRSSSSTFCYCRGDLCNSAPKTENHAFVATLTIAVIFTFKYPFRIL
ncbi:PREDICTED: uncharacterized protein LOC108569374 isoform X2 [Nicrophorus vespilloides]|uniref:Uncharacterized protein LOC108569374 isoform X2 n=1 Tax=Nicrophorus vespilloides TaxID=110193 RepID=A0ABM1NHT6_NICVS|nr:PREDICTED: uncharacterized protein LOC108569374 isoform X2 [Nicrophorus vespilloides]